MALAQVLDVSPIKEGSRVHSQLIQKGDIGSVYGGTTIAGEATVEEALVLAGLDFNVKLVPATYNGKSLDDRFYVVREDTDQALDVVGSRFKPIQNREAFRFVDRLVGEGAAVISSAGALYNGRMTWFDLNLGSFEVGMDLVRKHLLIVNYHDGSSKLKMKALPERPRCQNALDYMLRDRKYSFEIAHTASGSGLLERAHHVLEYSDADFQTVADRFNDFALVKMKPSEMDPIIYRALGVEEAQLERVTNHADEMTRTPNWVSQHEKVRELIFSGPGSQGVSGTLWGVFNGINSFFDHGRSVRNEANKPDVRLDSRMFGHSAKGKRLAFKVCSEYADAIHLN